MRPPGLSAPPPPARPPAAIRRPPPAARRPGAAAVTATHSLRRRRRHCQPRRHRHRLGPQPRGQAPSRRPPPLAAAPPPLPGPRASRPAALRTCSATRASPAPPFPASPLGFQAVAPRHSGAWPLRTCVRLTAPFSTCSPLPVSSAPPVPWKISVRGLRDCAFLPWHVPRRAREICFPHPFSASPDFLETPHGPSSPASPSHRQLQRRSPPHGEGGWSRESVQGRGRTSPASFPTVSPPSPCPRQPGRRRTLARTRLHLLGEAGHTLEGDWDLGAGAGVLV